MLEKLLTKLVAETTEVEFKENIELKKPKSWLKTVSAFSNGIGGIIYFGVSDERKIVGIENVQECIEKISELIKTRIEPLTNFNISAITQNNKKIIKLEIIQGTKTPYYYVADGNKVVFVRIGNESVNAPTYIINELVAKGERLTFDGMLSKYKYNDLSFTLFKATYLQKTGKQLEENDFISFGLMNEDKKLTYAGVLFSDQCPLLQSRIFCTRWNGLDKTSIFEDAVDDKEYSGNLIMLLDNGFNFIKNHNKKAWKKLPRSRVEYYDYNERIITELLVNALIHRMYDIIGAEIHIDIYDDRLEIESPGGMYDGSIIQNQDVLNIPSKRRNPIIADLFQRLDLMERRGSGFKKIYEILGNDKDKIKFFSNRTDFKVTLYNQNYNEKIVNNADKVPISADKVPVSADKVPINREDIEKIIIEYLQENEYVTNRIIKELYNLKDTRVKKVLRTLVEEKVIISEGANKNRRYRLNKKI